MLFGSAVAVAVHLASSDMSRGQRWYRTLTAVVFWPLYLPALLQHPSNEVVGFDEDDGPNQPSGGAEADETSAAIHQVETELDSALISLGGWSDAVLAREQHRFEELRVAWHAQAAKIRELNRILCQLAL